MSDTPETDASTISRHYYWGDDLDPNGDIVPADFARCLERERNAARREVERMSASPRTNASFASADDVSAVEDLVGMGHGAWDMVRPEEIIEAAWSIRGKK